MSIAVLRSMNAEERERRNRCVSLGCIACLMSGNGACGACEYHHILVAGERAGHRFGVALGQWHHQGVLLQFWTEAAMLAQYGPSLKLHGKAFVEEFGTDQALLDYQDRIIYAEPVVLPTRRRSRGSAASPSNIFPRGGFR